MARGKADPAKKAVAKEEPTWDDGFEAALSAAIEALPTNVDKVNRDDIRKAMVKAVGSKLSAEVRVRAGVLPAPGGCNCGRHIAA
jgi:hypothetical protein